MSSEDPVASFKKLSEEEKIKEILKSCHSAHVREGHQVILRDFFKQEK